MKKNPSIDDPDLIDKLHRQIFGDENQFEKELQELIAKGDVEVPTEELPIDTGTMSPIPPAMNLATIDVNDAIANHNAAQDDEVPVTPTSPVETRRQKTVVLLDQRYKLYRIAAYQAKQVNDIKQSKALLRKSILLRDLTEKVKKCETVETRRIPVAPVLNPQFTGPVYTETICEPPWMVRYELSKITDIGEKREKLSELLDAQTSDLLQVAQELSEIKFTQVAEECRQLALSSGANRYALNLSTPRNPLEYSSEFHTVQYPLLNKNLSMNDNTLQIQVTWIIRPHIRLTKSDSIVSTFVKFEFPYPSEDESQNYQTQDFSISEAVSKGQATVRFNANTTHWFHLQLINLRAKLYLRVLRRGTLTEEVLFPIEISLKGLERTATVKHLETLNDDQGYIEFTISQCRPYNGSQFIITSRPWLTVTLHFDDDTPSMRNQNDPSTVILRSNSRTLSATRNQNIITPIQPGNSSSLSDSSQMTPSTSSVSSGLTEASSLNSTKHSGAIYSLDLLVAQQKFLLTRLRDTGLDDTDRRTYGLELNRTQEIMRDYQQRLTGPGCIQERSKYITELEGISKYFEIAIKSAKGRNDLPQVMGLQQKLTIVEKELSDIQTS